MDDDSRLIPPDQLADALHFDSTMVTDLTGATIGQAGRIKVNEGVSVVTYNYKTGLGAPGAELKMPVTLEINQGYTVSFNVGAYGYRVPDQKVAKGGTAREPKDPTDPYPTDPEEKNWEFKGWYTDNTFATPFDFKAPITADVTAYAKWEKAASEPTGKSTAQPTNTDNQVTPEGWPITGANSSWIALLGAAAIAAGWLLRRRRA